MALGLKCSMKRFLTILGAVFGTIIVVAVIAAVIFVVRAMKLDGEATAYIQDAAPKILQQWNVQELVDRATPELLAAAKSREQFDRMFAMFRQLGTLNHLDAPKGSITSGAFTSTGVVTIGNYTATAEFEQGAATLQIQLRRVDDTWKINGFYIKSDVFLPQKPKTEQSA